MSSLTDDNPVQWDIVESDAAGLTEDEAYQLLSGALPAQIFGTPLAAASKPNAGHTGGMIALVPSDPERLAVAGGEPEEQLHLTLAFLGEASEISEQARQQILDAARRYAGGPIEANAFSINVFNPGGTSDGKEACVVLGVGNAGPELVDLQSSVVSSLRGMSGFKLPEQHNPWVPHITLAYTDDFTKLKKWADRVGPVTFDKLRVAFGDEVTDIPLGQVVTAAFDENQPRDDEGKWTDSGSVGKLATPATIYKPHADGTVVAQSGNRNERIRWNSEAKKYAHEKREGDDWIKKSDLTKTAAYQKLKEVGKWFTAEDDAVPKTSAPKQVKPTEPKTLSVSDNAKLTQLNTRLAQITQESLYPAKIHTDITHKAGTGKVLTKVDIQMDEKAQEQLAALRAEGQGLALQKLELLSKRDGAPWGGDTSEVPKKPPVATLLPGADKDKIQKARDTYVANDKLTIANNKSLRTDDPPAPAAISWRGRMNKMVQSSVMADDAVVYRGAVFTPEMIMKLKPGTVITDKGIMSTDEDRATAEFYGGTRAGYNPGNIETLFTVNVAKGTPGIDVGYGEFVFGSDSNLRITGSRLEGSKVYITAELIPAAKKGSK